MATNPYPDAHPVYLLPLARCKSWRCVHPLPFGEDPKPCPNCWNSTQSRLYPTFRMAERQCRCCGEWFRFTHHPWRNPIHCLTCCAEAKLKFKPDEIQPEPEPVRSRVRKPLGAYERLRRS